MITWLGNGFTMWTFLFFASCTVLSVAHEGKVIGNTMFKIIIRCTCHYSAYVPSSSLRVVFRPMYHTPVYMSSFTVYISSSNIRVLFQYVSHLPMSVYILGFIKLRTCSGMHVVGPDRINLQWRDKWMRHRQNPWNCKIKNIKK